jgi:type II secretory pathway pseudopilin PulG
MRAHRASAGVTLVETAISVAIVASLAVGIGGVMRASGSLARRAHANQTAAQQNRRALERIANALRSASLDSLSGFDADGKSTEPQFRPVTGTSGGTPTLGAAQTIRWYSKADRCGAANAGEVDLVVGGVRTCLANRVQSGGFRVALSGSTIEVFLTTYTPNPEEGLVHASGEASVTIRN